MEQNIAILIIDLSGYTALTETHGAEAAANLIDKYTAIVANCLVGNATVHERTGDELMIISPSSDSLAATTINILKKTAEEEFFLQVHGGLHYGGALKRSNSYFGTTINLAARIASSSDAGKVLCSEEFIGSLSDRSILKLVSKGSLHFKNISGERELFEIDVDTKHKVNIDPICRMLILNRHQAVSHSRYPNQYFCSRDCLNTYKQRREINVAHII